MNRLTSFLNNGSSSRSVGVIGAGVVLLLTVLFLAVVVYPIHTHTKHALKEAESNTQLQQRINSTRTLTQVVRKQLDDSRTRVTESPMRLIEGTGLNGRLATLTELCAKSGVTAIDVRPGTAVETPHYAVTPVRLLARGPYPNVTRLLRAIHRQHPDLAVVSFKLSTLAAGPAECEIRLNWYALPVANPAMLAGVWSR